MATGDKKRALMADDLNNAGSDYPVMPLKTVDSSPDASHTNNLITSAAVAAALADKADKTGLTDIFTTGSTNNSGGAIGAGVFFYKDGTLVQAKTAIASGATLTLNTNYEVPTAGALNALKAAMGKMIVRTGDYEVISGVIRLTNVFQVDVGAAVLATVMRGDNAWNGYIIYPRVIAANDLALYVRNASDGQNAPNGTYTISFIVVNP